MVPSSFSSARASGFVARTVEGKEVTAPFALASDVLSLRQVGVALPAFPTDEHLVLANGDRIPARDLRLVDEKVFFQHKDLNAGKEVSLPLAAVALIWRLPPDGTVSPPMLRHRLLRTNRPRDQVFLRNGDTVEGTLSTIKVGNVEVEVNKKPVTARWPQVATMALSSELLDRLRPKDTYSRVVVVPGPGSPGGRFTLTNARSEGKVLEGKTVFGANLSVPLERVAEVEQAGGDIVELTDLKPAKYEYSPYLDEKWAYSLDSSVTGRDLSLGGSTYARGIGLYAASRLTYSLGGAYRRFDAVVGLDDHDGRKGRVKLSVHVDGKAVPLTKKDVWTHADGVLRVSVDVKGAKELTLVVDHADEGPVQGAVNWANPRLVK